MSNSPMQRLNDVDGDKKAIIKDKKANEKPLTEERFEGPGLSFKGKLIGIEQVAEAKGEKMCQVAIAKLKAAVLALKEHKEKITLNLSFEGIALFDDKMENLLHRHEIEKISFVSRDVNDSRAFGYVFDDENDKFWFCAIKTEKSAEPVMAAMKELFQFYYEKQETNKLNENDPSGGQQSQETDTDGDGQNPVNGPQSEPTNSTNDGNLVENGDSHHVGFGSVLLETSNVNKEIFEQPQDNLMGPEPDIIGLNVTPGGNNQSSSPAASILLNQMPTLVVNGPFANNPNFSVPQTPPRLAPPPPHFIQGHIMTSPFPGATVRGPGPFQVANQFVSPAVACSPLQQQQQNYNHNMPYQTQQTQQQFYNNSNSNNGWTSFDSSQSQFVNSKQQQQHSLTNNPFATPLEPQQQNLLKSVSSEPDFSTSSNNNSNNKSNLYDPFSDLALLNTKPNPFMKKPTREDFVKEPPKPSLHDLAIQQKQQLLPPPSQQPKQPPPLANDFNLVSCSNGGTNHITNSNNNSNSVISPCGSLDGSDLCGDAFLTSGNNDDKIVYCYPLNPEIVSLRDSHNNNSSPNLMLLQPGAQFSSPPVLIPFPLLGNRSHPINIDFSAQRFSPLEDRRNLAKPTVVDWLSEGGSKADSASPPSLPGSLETKQPPRLAFPDPWSRNVPV